MVTVKRSKMQRYGVAVLAVVLAILLMLLLNPWVGMSQSPFLMFFGAVMVSAWYGGMGAGLVATLLSALLSTYFFVYPTHSLVVDLSDIVRLSVFVLEGLLISALCEALRSTNQRIEVSMRKLRVSEERYRHLIDTAYEGIWTVDAQGRINYVNQRMAEMLGYSVQEMLEHPVFNFMDEEARTIAKRNLERRKQGIKEQYDFQFSCRDGSELWTIVSTNPIFSETGEFEGELAMMTDVSNLYSELRLRKRAEEALRKSEKQFRLAVDNFPDTFAIYDANRRIQFVNAQGLKLTEKSLEEFLRHTDEEVWPSEVTNSYLPLLKRAVETRTSQTKECDITVPNIGNFTMIVKYVPLLDETGEIFSILGITHDITVRKQAEEALKESAARFRSVVESNMIGIGFWERDGHITDVNDALLEMLGYTREEFLSGNRRWQDLTPPKYYLLDEKAFAQTIATGFCTPYEKEYIRKDGSRFPIVLGGGHFQGCKDKGSFFVLDISDRKQAELALRQSEAKFRRLFDSNIVGIIFPDLSGNIFEANDAFLDMVGYTREDLLAGRVRWDTMTPPEYRHLDDRSIEELRISGVCNPFEKEYICKDGSLVPVLLMGALLEGSEHNTVSFILDLSDRKRAEKERAQLLEREQAARSAAEAARKQVSLIIESITDGFLAFDSEWRFTYLNREGARTLGRPPEELLGKNLWEEFPELANTSFGKLYQRVFAEKVPLELEDYYPPFDAWFAVRAYPTEMGGLSLYFRNISVRKLAEAEIQQLNESLEQRVQERTAQLEAANQELESFSYSVSHDLRAPLRHISGFVDLLQKRTATTVDETSLRYLNTIVQTTKQAGTLIDNLLAFSRMGRTQMRYTTINMNQLVQEVQRDIELETHGRAICWRVEELSSVQGDPSLLRLVLSNLIENAVKYTQTRAQAEIEIGCTENDSEVVFFIRDNGVGFDMRYVHKLFGVFQRLHSAEQFEGTGIGLANVQRIIHRHGGRTWAEGVVDSGATFYFSLPKKG